MLSPALLLRIGKNARGTRLEPLPEFRRAVADRAEPQVVNGEYSAVFSLDYLRPQVRPEIGPLAVPIGLTERLPS